MAADLHQVSRPGPMLRCGFWLYVSKVETPKDTIHQEFFEP